MSSSESDNNEYTLNVTNQSGANTISDCDDGQHPFFREKTQNSDLVLVIEDEEIYVCKAILAIASPVFSAMFESEFKEKAQDRIELPGKKLEDLVELLQCIYPNFLKDVTEANVYKVTPLADEYQIDTLKNKCHEFLIQKMDENTNAEEVIRHLHLAEQYGMAELGKACILLASELPVKEMNTWMEVYSVSEASRDGVKTKALMRFELENEDNDFVKDQLTGEFYSKLKSKMTLTTEIGVRNHTVFSPPTTSSFGLSNNTGVFGSAFGMSTGPQHNTKKDISPLRRLRLLDKYFQTDTKLKQDLIWDIRQKISSFSEKEREMFELLPKTLKQEIRGKLVWSVPKQGDK